MTAGVLRPESAPSELPVPKPLTEGQQPTGILIGLWFFATKTLGLDLPDQGAEPGQPAGATGRRAGAGLARADPRDARGALRGLSPAALTDLVPGAPLASGVPRRAASGDKRALAFLIRSADILGGRLAVDEPLANRVRSGRKQP